MTSDIVKNRADVTVVMGFFVALALFGAIGGALAVKDYARARESHAWTRVDGVVLSPRGGVDLRYAYAFKGRKFVSRRVRHFSAWAQGRAGADYAPGQRVEVYVDPERPARAVLQPGGARLAFVFAAALCGAFVFVGVGGIVWTFGEAARAANAVGAQKA